MAHSKQSKTWRVPSADVTWNALSYWFPQTSQVLMAALSGMRASSAWKMFWETCSSCAHSSIENAPVHNPGSALGATMAVQIPCHARRVLRHPPRSLTRVRVDLRCSACRGLPYHAGPHGKQGDRYDNRFRPHLGD